MFHCRSSPSRLSLVPFAVAAVLSATTTGCQQTPRRIDPPNLEDHFGGRLESQPITAESVGEREMLHRRWQLELKAQAAIPTGFFQSNGFDVGPSLGLKTSIETEKDLFIGLDFDWATWEQKDGVESLLDDPASLSGVEPDQLFEDLDRYNILLAIDYDWTIARSLLARNDPLKWRFGIGLGATVIEGHIDEELEDQVKAAGSDIDIVPYFGFCARFGTGLRWQLTDNVILFSQATYDFVYPFEMQVRLNRNRSEVDEDIDFGSVNLGAGVAFEF